jgi:hypothetical protein
MKTIAFVTSSEVPEISEDDKILARQLDNNLVMCRPTAWDDGQIDWDVFDLVLVRSCWNYHMAPVEFVAWIERFRNSHALCNSAELILWNMNKYYLKELEQKGVRIPETVWIPEGDLNLDTLDTILFENKWNKAVLKPCVSASSFHTNVIERGLLKQKDELSLKFIAGGMMVQRFVESILHNGELSLMYFAGQFSHAVIKTARPGDFRVQHQFGGKSEPIEVSKEIVRAGEEILSNLTTVPLYARVDGVMINNTFTLMELELIEPVLFFKHAPPDSIKRLAALLSAMV